MSAISPSDAHAGLSKPQLQAYHRDGFVVVPSLYQPQQMLAWKQTIEQVLAQEKFDDPSGVRVWWAEGLHPTLRRAMRDQRVTPILKQIIGPDLEFLSAKAVFKNAVTKFPSPWHQDWFYWEGAPKVSIWIALDNATPENGCLQFIPGSQVKVFPRKVVGGNAFVNRIEESDLAGWTILSVPAKRGDAVFFHDLAVHSSHTNASGADRWSLISTYRDGSVQDESKVWQTPMHVSGRSVHAATEMAD